MSRRVAVAGGHGSHFHANRLGILAMIGAMACFIVNDALVCLLATVLLAVRDLVTRRVHIGVPSILITLSNTIAVMLLAGGLTLLEGWRPLRAFEMALLAVAAVFLATAYYLIVTSTRRGDLSIIAPFRYTGLLFATIAGFVVWGDRPNGLAWCGIALVIASGVYVLRASRIGKAHVDPA